MTAHDSFEYNGVSFGTIKANVQQILTHPNYNRQTKDNDIALVKLTSPVDISGTSYFVPACLPGSASAKYSGEAAKVVGWSQGRVNKFCKDEVPVMDNRVCNRDTQHSGRITGKHFNCLLFVAQLFSSNRISGTKNFLAMYQIT